MKLQPIVDNERPQEISVEHLQAQVMKLMEAMGLHALNMMSHEQVQQIKTAVRHQLTQCPSSAYNIPLDPYLTQLYSILQHTLTSFWTCIGWTVDNTRQALNHLDTVFKQIEASHHTHIEPLEHMLQVKCTEFIPAWRSFVQDYVKRHPHVQDGPAYEAYMQSDENMTPWEQVEVLGSMVEEGKWKTTWNKFKDLAEQCHTQFNELEQIKTNIQNSTQWDKEASKSRLLTQARNKMNTCKALLMDKEREALANLQQQTHHAVSSQAAQLALANHCSTVNQILQGSFLSVHSASE